MLQSSLESWNKSQDKRSSELIETLECINISSVFSPSAIQDLAGFRSVQETARLSSHSRNAKGLCCN